MNLFSRIKENLLEKIEWILGFVILLGIIYGSYTVSKTIVTEPAENENVRTETARVILDAGHGGRDPGKVGVNEVLEKDINLAIVLKIQKLLEEEGITVMLTRTEDTRLDENGQEYSKMADMESRVQMINEVRPEMVVSIHQNSYGSEEIKGAQVFYYTDSEESQQMAEIMQESLRTIDPTNDRQIKADSTYYMLKKTEVPTLIVECGFLTNWEEAEKLADEVYQEEMAKAIVDGIKKCLEKN